MQLIAETVRQACHWSSDVEESTDEADDQLHHKQNNVIDSCTTRRRPLPLPPRRTTESTTSSTSKPARDTHRNRRTVARSHDALQRTHTLLRWQTSRTIKTNRPDQATPPRKKKKRKAAGRDNGDPESGLMTTPKRKKVGSPTQKIASGVDTKETIGRMERKSKGVTETVSAGE